jgi:SAM-dependent methyltransferase
MSKDESVFAGTAAFYARYRPPYPQNLIADIASHYGLNGTGRLLDLGCGPGTLTFPLSPFVTSAVAIDIESSMVEEAQSIQQSFDDLRRCHIDWRVMPAEAISRDLGTFRVVTCGSSFHWMDRDLVLRLVAELLEPESGIALVGGITSWLDGPEDWHSTVTRVIRSYIGESRRSMNAERFEQTLPRNGWSVDLERDYPTALEWDADTIVGHLWSTSFANRALFGDRVEEFEAELRAELLRQYPNNVFRETAGFGLVCGRPPTTL